MKWIANGDRIKWVSVFLSAIAGLVGLPSCSMFHSEKKPEKPAAEPAARKLVGRVASISADSKFVLIQSYGAWDVPVGSVLTTQGERSSNLLSTGESLGQYAAADIQGGMPAVGDGVHYLNPQALKISGDNLEGKPISRENSQISSPEESVPMSDSAGNP